MIWNECKNCYLLFDQLIITIKTLCQIIVVNDHGLINFHTQGNVVDLRLHHVSTVLTASATKRSPFDLKGNEKFIRLSAAKIYFYFRTSFLSDFAELPLNILSNSSSKNVKCWHCHGMFCKQFKFTVKHHTHIIFTHEISHLQCHVLPSFHFRFFQFLEFISPSNQSFKSVSLYLPHTFYRHNFHLICSPSFLFPVDQWKWGAQTSLLPPPPPPPLIVSIEILMREGRWGDAKHFLPQK